MKALFEIEWDGSCTGMDASTLQEILTTANRFAVGRGKGYEGLRVRAVDAFSGTLPAGEKAFVDDLAPPKPDVQVSAQPEAAPWPYTAAGEFIRWLSMLPNFDSKTLHIEVVVKQ